MPCFHPLHGFKSPTSGKWLSIHSTNNYKLEPLTIPCGKCTGCRTEYSRQWAIRIQHEQSLWPVSVFITLTYNDDHLPKKGNSTTLIKKDFQDFMKRLREPNESIGWEPPKPIRYYHCGEYGEQFGRPHYHAILFNTTFPDLKQIQGKKDLKTSKILDTIWGKGFTSVGAVTFESASYVAGYVQKKINGEQKDSHYAIVDPETGEYFGQRQQEYSTMSRRPGIAGHWFAKHKDDVYPSDNIHIRGREMRPPKYYDRLYEIEYPSDMEKIKENRKEAMKETEHLRTPEALRYAEKTHKARMSLYKRKKL
jgi:hypothetical protein